MHVEAKGMEVRKGLVIDEVSESELKQLYTNAQKVKTKEEVENELLLEKLRKQAVPATSILRNRLVKNGISEHAIALFVTSLGFLLIVGLGFLGGDYLAEALVDPEPIHQDRRPQGQELSFIDDESIPLVDVDYALVLREFYKKFNPARIADVPNILSRYNQKEEQLFEKLKAKYGVSPLSAEFGYDGVNAEVSQDDSSLKVKEHTVDELKEPEDISENLFEPEPWSKKTSNKIEEESQEKYKTSDQHSRAIPSFPKTEQFLDSHHLQRNRIPKQDHEFLEEFQTSPEDFLASDDSSFHVSKVSLLCFGMPLTGLYDLRQFLAKEVGLMTTSENVAEFAPIMFDGEKNPDFLWFDRYEAIIGFGPSTFFKELLVAYPRAKVLITTRKIEDWYRDMKSIFESSEEGKLLKKCVKDIPCEKSSIAFNRLFQFIFGSSNPREHTWKRKYTEFYNQAFNLIPRSRRIVLDLFTKDKQHDPWLWIRRFMHQNGIKSYDEKEIEPKSLLRGKVSSNYLQVPDSMLHLHKMTSSTENNAVSGQIKIIGVGLDNTGELVLGSALKRLGYTVFNSYDVMSTRSKGCSKHTSANCAIAEQLKSSVLEDSLTSVDFGYTGVMHGVDSIIGPIAAIYGKDIFYANPDSKVVLTVRNLNDWLRSMKCYFDREPKKKQEESGKEWKVATTLKNDLYGSSSFHEYLLKSKYRDHVNRIAAQFPKERLLILDLSKSKTYEELCRFTGSLKCNVKLSKSSLPSVHTHC